MLKQFLNNQLQSWPLAQKNFETLSHVQTREIILDGFPITLQHNPARIVSTGAKINASEIKKRPCFLCQSNRPAEQQIIPFSGSREYEILVNPFPIAPQHFTIAAKEHTHQDNFEPEDMAKFAREYPGYVAFYNGSTAGASAPDHLHFQACNVDFIQPLIEYASARRGELIKATENCRIYALNELPMHALHIESKDVDKELSLWLSRLVPASDDGFSLAIGNRNIFMWVDEEGILHTVLFPRKAHRPACYFADGDELKLVSPGALDMAGVIILPRPQDYGRIDKGDVRRIYNEVSCEYRDLPSFSRLLLL